MAVNAPQLALDLMQGWLWFRYVPPEAREWLAAHAGLKRFEKGQTVYLDREPARYLYGVLSGVFRVYTISEKGDEITHEEVVRGAWFQHMIPEEPLRHAASCACQESAECVTLPLSAVSEFAQRWPGWYRGLYHEFTNRWDATRGRIELLSLHTLNVRLAVYLLRLLNLRGQPQPDGALWLPVFDHQAEVAARVGGTRQRVNGILKAWTRRGLIAFGQQGVQLLDIDGLMAEARKTGFDLDGYLAAWHGGWQGSSQPLQMQRTHPRQLQM